MEFLMCFTRGMCLMFDRASLVQDFRKDTNDFREVPKRLLEHIDLSLQTFLCQATTGRHEKTRNIGPNRLNYLQSLRPTQVGHLHVHQNDVDWLFTKKVDCYSSAAGGEDSEVL